MTKRINYRKLAFDAYDPFCAHCGFGILLAIWASSVISKERQLEMYLAAVRFEYGVLGVAAACKYFFGDIKKEISNPEAFFLIERLSNVRSRLLGPKILQTLRRAVSDGALSEEDIVEIVDLYRKMVKRGVIQDVDPVE